MGRYRRWEGATTGCLIDESGSTLWSRKVVNGEAAILHAISEVLSRAQQVSWGVGISGTSSALLLALPAAHGQQATYVPGRTVNQMSTAHIGEAKTDARDAYVIAETGRHRGDLTPVDVPAALVTELRLLATHSTDLVADRVRLINRLRDVLSGYFPFGAPTLVANWAGNTVRSTVPLLLLLTAAFSPFPNAFVALALGIGLTGEEQSTATGFFSLVLTLSTTSAYGGPGRRLPLLAVGNAKGDIELLDSGQRALLLRHDDADREHAYKDQDALSAARTGGWTVVSIREDFAGVFSP